MEKIKGFVTKYKKVLVTILTIIIALLLVKKFLFKKKVYTNTVRDDASQLDDASLDEHQKQERILILREMAERLSYAFWDFKIYAFGTIVIWRVTEDEQLAIRILNELRSPNEAQLISEYYRQYNVQYDTGTLLTPQKGLSLKADILKFLTQSQISQIPRDIFNSLK